MNDTTPNNTPPSTAVTGFSPLQWLKNKRISYLTLPLLVMATVTEFVILSTGWKYQQVVCLPAGMGVTFFGIGPIGATILAVELLKLPLAIWTASRSGWQKAGMLVFGLPLICVLTFQLVKDMAVYEMGVALKPATEFLVKATDEEVKADQINGELSAIEQKKADRQAKLAEIDAKDAKAKADLADALKRNDDSRTDAISLTDYQKKQLTDVDSRETTIIQQFNADTAQLTKEIADLHAQREVEVGRSSKWNAEDARIDNEYKAQLSDYQNKKAAYDKAEAAYENANIVTRQFMSKPVDPGVPPVRQDNTVLKPTAVADIDAQITAKESELLAVNNKRRDRIAQVEADASQIRQEFDQRSTSKREESDKKRDELTAAGAATELELQAERKQIDSEYAAAAQKVDGLHADFDAAQKQADIYYEDREAAIRNTQVHRIATTVEIVRGLFKGEKPVSIKLSAKERGDLLTDQISMVRIWVYPVLAFIVAFLPTLMVEMGFSTVFEPEKQRPSHRLGFLGRHMHWLYIRAGRQKILCAERRAAEATAQISTRDKAVIAAKAETALALAGKEAAAKAAQESIAAADAARQAELEKSDEAFRQKEEQWITQLAGMSDSLNRVIVEKDALHDLQKSEIERQIQMRQNAWSERLTLLRQELDAQRNAAEAERTAMLQDHHQKLMEITEDSKTQVIQARRQMADAELAAVDKTAKLSQDLKEAVRSRDFAEAQLKQQSDALTLKLSQAQEDAARDLEKLARQEKHRFDRQELEFEQILQQRDEEAETRLKQREQELTMGFEARLAEEKARLEQDARRHEAELVQQLDVRAHEAEVRRNRETQAREEAGQARLKQREQQLQAQAEARLREVQTQAEEAARRQAEEFERQLDSQTREAEGRLREELQQRDLAAIAKLQQREQELAGKALAREAELKSLSAVDVRAREGEWKKQAEDLARRREQEFQRQLEVSGHEATTRLRDELAQKDLVALAKLQQREQELTNRAAARETELKTQWTSELRTREGEWKQQADARVRTTEARLAQEAQQKDEAVQLKLRQREHQLQSQFDARQAELQGKWDEDARRRDAELAEAKHREQEVATKLAAQAQAHKMSEEEWQTGLKMTRDSVATLEASLSRTEKERDEARKTADEGTRQLQNLRRKSMEASTLLNGWHNGEQPVGNNRG